MSAPKPPDCNRGVGGLKKWATAPSGRPLFISGLFFRRPLDFFPPIHSPNQIQPRRRKFILSPLSLNAKHCQCSVDWSAPATNRKHHEHAFGPDHGSLIPMAASIVGLDIRNPAMLRQPRSDTDQKRILPGKSRSSLQNTRVRFMQSIVDRCRCWHQYDVAVKSDNRSSRQRSGKTAGQRVIKNKRLNVMSHCFLAMNAGNYRQFKSFLHGTFAFAFDNASGI